MNCLSRSVSLFLTICIFVSPLAHAAKKKDAAAKKQVTDSAVKEPSVTAPPVPHAPVPVIIKGRIVNPKENATAPAFLYENSRVELGTRTISRTRYTDLNSKSLVEEENIYEDGKFLSYKYDQLQTDEHGTITVKDKKVFYSFTSEGKTKTDSGDFNDGMMSADMIQDKIRANWDLIAKGDDLQTRFLVLEVQDDFGFKIFKDEETTFAGKPALALTMKASGFFVALAAPNFRITVEKEAPHRLLEINGRLPIRIPRRLPVEKRDDLKAMDGILTLEYPSAIAAKSLKLPAAGHSYARH